MSRHQPKANPGHKLTLLPALFATGVAIVGSLHATEITPAQAAFFTDKIQPILQEQCFKCHSHAAERIKGGLVADSLAGLLQGGDTGPAIVPGKPDASLLVKAINYQDENLQMPPKGKKLSADQIALLTDWVKQGAPWPGSKPAAKVSRVHGKITAEDRSWWAFQPVKNPTPPAVTDNGWARNDIDRFIFARLQKENLTPAPEASKTALIRRVTFDLTGLPPTPEEIEAFLADNSSDAYEKLVDRLLASPHYGERWARHWLDLVHYADSDGYRIDDYRPDAWHYRDYVINSFNTDKPYDRFVKEQLAGDELYPNDPEALIATGYLRHWIYEYNARDARGQWTTILNDLTDTTGDVFFGLGMQCARCHDHKFDPILQKDYYRLQAFFAPILPRLDLVAATAPEKAAYAAKLAKWEAKTVDLRRQIADLEAKPRAEAKHEALERFPDDVKAMIYKPDGERQPYEEQMTQLAYRQVDYEYGRLERRFKGEEKEKYLALKKQLAQFDKDKPEPLPIAFAATDVGPKAPPVFIPKKGPEPIEPGFPSVLDEKPAVITPVPTAPNSTGRRTALADWLTNPANPLTGRVIVNRMWQYHFGHGLAANASDFGKLGEKPSHPELLDWLASRFVQDGWSLKKLHRLIVTSTTYREATDHPQPEAGRLKDPENRLLWRGNLRRLEAEQIRDALYATTGELNFTAGGPGVMNSVPRRAIYSRIMRNTRDPLFDVFDAPFWFSSASSRDTTTTPVQSLLLINSQFMLQRAKAFAARLEKDGSGDEARLVDDAYRLAFGRLPTPGENTAALKFLSEQQDRIDPVRAGSAKAAFLYDKLQFRDGQAAVMSPEGPQSRFEVADNPAIPTEDFTIEAFVMIRSVYDSGSVRTVAAKWNGSMKTPGWGFGITGKQSRRKPQTLVMQIIGTKQDGTVGEEALFSDQNIQINKPYYLAAAVKLATKDAPGQVTFFLKDLGNDDEPLLIAKLPCHITGGFANHLNFTIGGNSTLKGGLFDGLMDDVRLSQSALDVNKLLFTSESINQNTVGYWQFEAKPDVFRDSTGHGLDIKADTAFVKAKVDVRKAALADFCHALFNANEFLYVE